jgi:hypothetical protein
MKYLSLFILIFSWALFGFSDDDQNNPHRMCDLAFGTPTPIGCFCSLTGRTIDPKNDQCYRGAAKSLIINRTEFLNGLSPGILQICDPNLNPYVPGALEHYSELKDQAVNNGNRLDQRKWAEFELAFVQVKQMAIRHLEKKLERLSSQPKNLAATIQMLKTMIDNVQKVTPYYSAQENDGFRASILQHKIYVGFSYLEGRHLSLRTVTGLLHEFGHITMGDTFSEEIPYDSKNPFDSELVKLKGAIRVADPKCVNAVIANSKNETVRLGFRYSLKMLEQNPYSFQSFTEEGHCPQNEFEEAFADIFSAEVESEQLDLDLNKIRSILAYYCDSAIARNELLKKYPTSYHEEFDFDTHPDWQTRIEKIYLRDPGFQKGLRK